MFRLFQRTCPRAILVPRVHSLALKPCGPGKEVVLLHDCLIINSHSRRAELEEMALRRALHFVFKIGNRNETIKFYREILGMKVRGISYCVSDFGASFRACPLDDSVGSYNLAPCCIVVCCLYLINTVGIKSNSSRFLKECVLFIRFCAMKSLKRAVRHLAMGTYVM